MLNNGKELPGDHIGYGLHNSRRPFDPDDINICCVTQAEMRFQRILIERGAGVDFAQLPQGLSTNGCLHSDFGPNGRAVGNGAHQFEFEPAITVAVVAIEAIGYRAAFPASGQEQVQETVVVVVAPCATHGISSVVVHKAAGKYPGEGAVAIVVIEIIYAGTDSDFAMRHEQINKPVIVIVAPSATGENRRITGYAAD